MITLKKIRTLKDRTQLRKAALLMYRESEQRGLDDDYLEGLRNIVLSSHVLMQSDKPGLDALFSSYLASRDPLCAKDIYYMLLRLLGEEPAEWDFVTEDGRLDASGRTVLPHSLFLDRIRSPYNIGAIFRSAESFGVEHIYLRQGCGDVHSPRCMRTSRGAVDIIPYTENCDLSVLEGRTVFALETGGQSLSDFAFPESAVCVIGSEEDGVSPDCLKYCQNRVSIEMMGAKASINVSVAAGILLYSWAQSDSALFPALV